MLSQIFVTFGRAHPAKGLAQFFWKVDYRMIPETILSSKYQRF